MKATLTYLVLVISAFTATAQFITGFTGGDNLSVGAGTAGFSFLTGSSALSVTSLGVFDTDTASPGLYSSHMVGIWDVNRTLLGSVLVPAQGATLKDGFYYMPLPTPITLQAVAPYWIGASYADNDFDLAVGNVPRFTFTTTTSGIRLGDAYLSSGVGFEFPDINVAGADYGFFGSNALFTSVPEPSGWAWAMAGLLGAFALSRRLRWAFLGALALSLSAFAGVNQLENVPPPELPAVVAKLVKVDPASRVDVLKWIEINHPGALAAVQASLNAAGQPGNRPPITQGNVHGNRPLVPPGLENKYGSP